MATVEACPSAVLVGHGIKATGFGFASDAQAVRIKDARRVGGRRILATQISPDLRRNL